MLSPLHDGGCIDVRLGFESLQAASLDQFVTQLGKSNYRLVVAKTRRYEHPNQCKRDARPVGVASLQTQIGCPAQDYADQVRTDKIRRRGKLGQNIQRRK